MNHQLPKDNDRLKEREPGKESAHQATPDRLQDNHQAGHPGKAQSVEQGQAAGASTSDAKRLDWEAVAIWVFVGLSVAALPFAGYLLWCKCK